MVWGGRLQARGTALGTALTFNGRADEWGRGRGRGRESGGVGWRSVQHSEADSWFGPVPSATPHAIHTGPSQASIKRV